MAKSRIGFANKPGQEPVRSQPGGRSDTWSCFEELMWVVATLSRRVVNLREGVDRAWPGNGIVYFARLSVRRAQSRRSRIVGTSQYRQMTIRNWTTTALGRRYLPKPRFGGNDRAPRARRA
jgi:hypothetical protein